MSVDNVADIDPIDQYTASASQTAFDYSFPIFADADLVVYDNDTLMTLTTDYTVTGEGEDTGGTVTFTSGRTAGHIITIYRDIAIARTTDFQQNGARTSVAMNDELDRMTMWMQQLERNVGRAIRQTLRSSQASADLEIDSNFEGKYLYINDDGELEPAAAIDVTTLTQSVIAELLNVRTDAEIAASVVPDTYAVIPGSTRPGDITRYGVTNSSTAAQVAAAVQKALAAHKYAFIPYGTDGTWNWDPVVFTGTYQVIEFAPGVIATSSSSGRLIDFDGYKRCWVVNANLFSTTAAMGIRVGPDSGETRFAHWARVVGCHVNGRSTGAESGGAVSGFTTGGVVLERTYYTRVRDCDIQACPVGILGLNEANGDFITENSIRDCHRGIHMTDTTRNSDGTVIADNEIEGGLTGNLYGIDIQGCSNMMVRNNRLEYSTNGTAHIFVHDGANDAVRHTLLDNRCLGNRPSVIIGDNSGSNRVSAVSLKDGWYASSITIGVDCDYTNVEFPSNRYFGGGAGAVTASFTDNSTTTILSVLEDQTTTLTLTGCTTSPTVNITWTINRNVVSTYVGTVTGTSNTTACTLGTLPAIIRPASTRNFMVRVLDNDLSIAGHLSLATSGVFTLSNVLAGGGAMTNGNGKGLLSTPLTWPRNG